MSEATNATNIAYWFLSQKLCSVISVLVMPSIIVQLTLYCTLPGTVPATKATFPEFTLLTPNRGTD